MALTDKLSSIASAIREKTGESDTMTLDQMPENIRAISGKEDIEWHQCPELVRNYLAKVKEKGYTEGVEESYIYDFAQDTPTYSDIATNTKPVSVIVGGETFRDEEPLKKEPFATSTSAGTLKALDHLRWYNTTRKDIDHSNPDSHYNLGCNCRDLGGWNCDGGTIKYGKIVRSGELNPVDKALMVDKIGIKSEVCMLPVSVQQFKGYSPWGIDYVGNNTEDDMMYNLSAISQWKIYLPAIIRFINKNKPVIFHCGAGADKTGTVAVMVLGILGCSLQDIDADFELTTFFAGRSSYGSTQPIPGRNRTLDRYVNYKNAIKSFPLVSGLADTFANHCVSFALSLGISIEEINEFRSNMVSGTPATLTANIQNYSVTKSGDVTFSNTSNTAKEFMPYSTEIFGNNGKDVDSVSVTVGGLDVSADAVSLITKNNKTKAKVDIEKVSGAISMSATTKESVFRFDMNRTIASPSFSNPAYSASDIWDESVVWNNVLLQSGNRSSDNKRSTITNISSNSVTATNTDELVGAVYPIKVKGGKTYTLTYDYGAGSKARVYYALNIDGTATINQLFQSQSDTGAGNFSDNIAIPEGSVAWLFLGFSANTGLTKSYTNVSLVEN